MDAMNQLINTLAATSICMTAPAVAKSLSWTPSELMKVKLVSDVQISPDNYSVLIVATESVIEKDKNTYVSKIYRTEMHGNGQVLFSSSESSSVQPRWSPDGNWIAFISNRSGKKNLYVIPAHGGEAVALTNGKENVQTFRWSPDSRQIAFVRADETYAEKNQAIKRSGFIYKQDKMINRLWLIDISSPDSLQALTGDEYFVRGSGDFASFIEEFDWSADGKKLVFAYTKGSGYDHYHLDSSIAVLDTNTGVVTPWENQTSFEANPRFSPDGQWIAYVCCNEQPKYTYDRVVAIRSIDGNNSQQLSTTFNEGNYIFGPNLLGWTVDSSHVLFCEPKGTKFHLVLLPVDGSFAKEVATGDCFFRIPSLSYDRKMIGFVSESPSHPPEAFIANIEQFEPSQVTRLNERFLSFPIPKTEIVRWQSVDGLTIEGLLTYPLNYREGTQYPLALVIHGGPMGVFSETFVGNPSPYPCASFAESGLFVLRPNPRGSNGYGKAFRSGNLNDWGGKDFADLMAGIDSLIAQGKVDPERMGIMGWSYGGYMTAWTITQTPRFKAASVGAGLSNLSSMIGTTDVHRLLPDYLGDLCENIELYQSRSPVNFVQNVMTPCLIQHGLDDLRVPVSQAYEFYHALDRQGKQPILMLYPDCAHYFVKPRVELEAIEANLDWFVKYLSSD